MAMSDYGLVLNAGSSSLKFCVFQRPELSGWRIDVSGQVDGIGTSPRLAAHEADGEEIVDKPLDAGVSDPRRAINVLANFLRERYRGVRGARRRPSRRPRRSPVTVGPASSPRR